MFGGDQCGQTEEVICHNFCGIGPTARGFAQVVGWIDQDGRTDAIVEYIRIIGIVERG